MRLQFEVLKTQQSLASEENKQIKSALTEILNTLKKSEKFLTIQQVFKLPQVVKLTQVCFLCIAH